MGPSRAISLIKTALVYGALVAALAALAYTLGVYFIAILALALVVLYRRQILDAHRRAPNEVPGGDPRPPRVPRGLPSR